ncbi:MAG: hypothetical protein H7335_13315 [Massilia sp.]|nr:hypothetical protein [Massilia sp.]
MSSVRTTHKNKTAATFLALTLGWGGVHRMLLGGARDPLALLHLGAVAATLVLLALLPRANIFYPLLPIIVSAIAGCIEALVIGLMPDEQFDARYNVGSSRQSDSQWPLALLLVTTMLVGTTVLIATMSRLFDLLYTGGAYG